jgi:hypothetical protein
VVCNTITAWWLLVVIRRNPLAAISSKTGVLRCGCPLYPISPQPWSSAMQRMILAFFYSFFEPKASSDIATDTTPKPQTLKKSRREMNKFVFIAGLLPSFKIESTYAELSLVFVFVEGSVQELSHDNNNDQ